MMPTDPSTSRSSKFLLSSLCGDGLFHGMMIDTPDPMYVEVNVNAVTVGRKILAAWRKRRVRGGGGLQP